MALSRRRNGCAMSKFKRSPATAAALAAAASTAASERELITRHEQLALTWRPTENAYEPADEPARVRAPAAQLARSFIPVGEACASSKVQPMDWIQAPRGARSARTLQAAQRSGQKSGRVSEPAELVEGGTSSTRSLFSHPLRPPPPLSSRNFISISAPADRLAAGRRGRRPFDGLNWRATKETDCSQRRGDVTTA